MMSEQPERIFFYDLIPDRHMYFSPIAPKDKQMKWVEMTPEDRDALVEVKVMGRELAIPYETYHRYLWKNECGIPGLTEDTPHYSQSMDGAWQVLQKIASRYSEQSQWLVDEQFKEFVEELCECSGNEIYPATKFFVRMAAWTPEHICLLALKACGWKEGEQ